MTTQKAYRLGTVPRLVLRECRQFYRDKLAYDNALAHATEWLSILSELKASPLQADVVALQKRVAAEKQVRDAQAKYELQQRRCKNLRAMGEDAEPPVKPAMVSLPEPGSLHLAQALVEKAEAASTLEQLPAEIRSLYELGILVARCLYDHADEIAAMRIWTIAKGLGCESWATGTSGTSGEPVKGQVLSRLKEIDEMFSTQPLPEVSAKTVVMQATQAAESPYLTVEEAAKILKVGADTVERLISSGKLTASEISGRGKSRTIKRIHRSELDRYMEANRACISVVEPTARRSRKKPPTKDYIG